MAVSLAEFETGVKTGKKIRAICNKLGLDDASCVKLEGMIGDVCGELATAAKREKRPRKLSKWQLCIAERRKGKPFDPDAMKKLAEEYKAGRCP